MGKVFESPSLQSILPIHVSKPKLGLKSVESHLRALAQRQRLYEEMEDARMERVRIIQANMRHNTSLINIDHATRIARFDKVTMELLVNNLPKSKVSKILKLKASIENALTVGVL